MLNSSTTVVAPIRMSSVLSMDCLQCDGETLGLIRTLWPETAIVGPLSTTRMAILTSLWGRAVPQSRSNLDELPEERGRTGQFLQVSSLGRDVVPGPSALLSAATEFVETEPTMSGTSGEQ